MYLCDIPLRMIEHPFFWKLPHDLRRSLFRLAEAEKFKKLTAYRSRESEKITAQTFKPFLDTNTLFVHIPKTAGIAIGHAVYGRHTGNHTTIAEYELAFSKAEFNRFFRFAFVRNPWDRLFSAYTFLRAGGRNAGDRLWAEQHLDTYNSFEAFVLNWVNEENVQRGIHFKPQYQFLTLPGSDVLQVDFVGRYENLQQDWQALNEKLSTLNALKEVNKTNRKSTDYKSVYTAEMREVVARAYAKDIALFHYTFS